MNLKLYRIRTVVRYIPESWKNSLILKNKIHKSRIFLFLDLLYWFYFYGNDFNDYCSFRFWEKTYNEKKSYISLRRNDKLRFSLSTPSVHKLFLDKAEFNRKFSKFINREWLDCRNADDSEIQSFIAKHDQIIAKPIFDFGGHGVKKMTIEDLSITPPISYETMP